LNLIKLGEVSELPLARNSFLLTILTSTRLRDAEWWADRRRPKCNGGPSRLASHGEARPLKKRKWQ